MIRCHLRLLAVGLLLGVALVEVPPSSATDLPGAPDSAVVELRLGESVTRSLVGTQARAFRVRLAGGSLAKIQVAQVGFDAVVTVLDPSGTRIAEVDANGASLGEVELVEVDSRSGGDFRVEVRGWMGLTTPSDFRITLTEILDPEQRAAARARDLLRREAARRWIADHAARLTTVEPGRDAADLEPVGRMVGNARIVGLGEATHGTRDFQRLKHRLFEYLVTRMGFTVIAIEATMPEAFDVNRYVLTGEGDPERALAGLYFWISNTEEVLAMIRWMRRYNEDPRHTRKVKFYGVDMQYARRAARVVTRYFERVDSTYARELRSGLGLIANPISEVRFDGSRPEEQEKVAGTVRDAIARLEARRADYESVSGAEDYQVARQHLRIAEQYTAVMMGGERGSIVRDSAMAENVKWILEREGKDARMVLWAHNYHVKADTSVASGTLGRYLRRAYGDDYVSFGFAFNRGGFQAIEVPSVGGPQDLRPFEVGRAPEGSLDRTLTDAGLRVAALDLRQVPDSGAVREWFESGPRTRQIGGVFTPETPDVMLGPEVILQKYDALLFVDRTEAARGNPAGRRPRVPELPAPRNGDFEARGPRALPMDWCAPSDQEALGFRVATTEERPYRGSRCARIEWIPGETYGETFGRLFQRVTAGPYRGKRVRLRAASRIAAGRADDQAQLWMHVTRVGFGPAATIFRDDMADRPITESEWREYEITADVPEDAALIEFGLGFVGTGQAWLDEVRLEVVSP